VTTVALNLARSGLRRVIAERKARSRLQGIAGTDLIGPERVDVERALAKLPRRQREAVVCRYYLGMDTREIAKVLNVSEGTVKSTLFRARAALAVSLGVDEDEEANDRGAR
jgi:DNA-directed RNA polymerase specialized sigma24 family protein